MVILFIILIFAVKRYLENKFTKENNNSIYKIFTNLKNTKLKELLILFSLSIIYWISRIAFGYVILLGLQINPGFWAIVSIGMILMLLEIIPIKFFAGFGIFEGSWVFLLSLWNFQPNDTFLKILAMHFISLFPVILFGFVSYILLKPKRSKIYIE
jgi:uncharacterized protein (TIRG00374 family)